MRKLLIISLLVLSISIPYVSAHPFTEETSPRSAVNAPVGITEVTVIYSEPIELDFLLRENVYMSRKIRAFNYKYDFFTKKTKIKILKKEIYNINAFKKDKYFKNIGSYILISEIN